MGGLEIDRIDDYLCGACSLVGMEDGYVGLGVGTDLGIVVVIVFLLGWKRRV
jgi:hypothetical protein